MAHDFDDVLHIVGDFGRYQKKLLAVAVVSVAFIVAIQFSSQIFQTVVPDHWCSVPGRILTGMSPEQWKNLTIPRAADGAAYEQCEHYQLTWTNNKPSRSNQTQSCSSWEYDRSNLRETLATSNDWVCSKGMYSRHVYSVSIAGSILGTAILPYLADKYSGRRLMFFVAIAIHFVFNLASIFISNFPAHLAMRFLGGISTQTNYILSYTIAMELVSPSKRAFAAFLSFIAWTLGMCATSLLCFLISDWRYIIVLLLVTDVYFFSLWWYLPESPRWLLAKNRCKEATDTLLKVAKANGNTDIVQHDVILQHLNEVADVEEKRVSLLSILRFPRFRKRVLFLVIQTTAVFLGYSLLIVNINILPNRYFVNFFVLSLAELPSHVNGCIGVTFFGRRFTGIFTYFLCFCISVAAALVVDYKMSLLVLVFLLKCLIATSLYVLYLQLTEMYPTPLRTAGLGMSATLGLGMFALSNYIVQASNDNPALNYWILFGISTIGMLSIIPLPETLGLPLPQTLEDAETLGVGRSLLKWVHHWNVKKFNPKDDSDSNPDDDLTQNLNVIET